MSSYPVTFHLEETDVYPVLVNALDEHITLLLSQADKADARGEAVYAQYATRLRGTADIARGLLNNVLTAGADFDQGRPHDQPQPPEGPDEDS